MRGGRGLRLPLLAPLLAAAQGVHPHGVPPAACAPTIPAARPRRHLVYEQRGGFDRVTERKLWAAVGREGFNPPPSLTSLR